MINVNNFAISALRAPITPSSTVLPLNPGTGSLFALPVGDYVYITLQDRLNFEIVKYSASVPLIGDDIPVARAQDGTFARTFPKGTCVKITWNEAQLTEFVAQIVAGSTPTTSTTSCSTQVLPNIPTLSPPAGICYSFNSVTGRLYYWDSSASTPTWVNVTDGVNSAVSPTSTLTIGGATFTDNAVTAGTGGCEMLELYNRGLAVHHDSDPACIQYGITTVVNRPVGANNDKLVVGHQLVAMSNAGQTAPTFGLAAEAWVSSASAANAAIGTESAVIVQAHTRAAASLGFDSVFKNRPDTLLSGAVTNGLGNNQYNRFSRAIQISAQPRSTAGEFCGWNTGISFLGNSLDASVDGLAIGIDFSGIAGAGQTARVKHAIKLSDGLNIGWDNAGVLVTQFDGVAGEWQIRNNADLVNPLRFGIGAGTGIIHLQSIAGSGQPLVNPGVFTPTGSFCPINLNGTIYHFPLYT